MLGLKSLGLSVVAIVVLADSGLETVGHRAVAPDDQYELPGNEQIERASLDVMIKRHAGSGVASSFLEALDGHVPVATRVPPPVLVVQDVSDGPPPPLVAPPTPSAWSPWSPTPSASTCASSTRPTRG